MIKKKVTKNVVLSADELKFLADTLKEEILILRGQVVKAGQKYAHSKNKKYLAFIKNEEIKMDGGEVAEEGGEGETTEEKPKEEEKPSDEEKPNDKPIPTQTESLGMRTEVPMISSSRGNINIRKRQSLLDIDEETMILKYCELKAKLENLEEATRKRFIEDANKDAEAGQIIDSVEHDARKKIEEVTEKRIEEMGQANEKLDKMREDFANEKLELEKKISLLQLENEEKDKLIKEKDQKLNSLIENPNNTELIKEIAESQAKEEQKANENTENTTGSVTVSNNDNSKFKEMEEEFNRLKIDLEFKAKESEDNEQKWREVKTEYQILQSRVERLNMVSNK